MNLVGYDIRGFRSVLQVVIIILVVVVLTQQLTHSREQRAESSVLWCCGVVVALSAMSIIPLVDY